MHLQFKELTFIFFFFLNSATHWYNILNFTRFKHIKLLLYQRKKYNNLFQLTIVSFRQFFNILIQLPCYLLESKYNSEHKQWLMLIKTVNLTEENNDMPKKKKKDIVQCEKCKRKRGKWDICPGHWNSWGIIFVARSWWNPFLLYVMWNFLHLHLSGRANFFFSPLYPRCHQPYLHASFRNRKVLLVQQPHSFLDHQRSNPSHTTQLFRPSKK